MNDFQTFGTALGVAVIISGVALAMLWLALLIDVCITKSDVWVATGQDRWFCVLMLFGLGPLGAVIYGVAIRPQLARMEMKVAVGRAKRADQWAA